MLTLNKISFPGRRDGAEPSNYVLMAINLARPADEDSGQGRRRMWNIHS